MERQLGRFRVLLDQPPLPKAQGKHSSLKVLFQSQEQALLLDQQGPRLKSASCCLPVSSAREQNVSVVRTHNGVFDFTPRMVLLAKKKKRLLEGERGVNLSKRMLRI
jgi:hypothetical protein